LQKYKNILNIVFLKQFFYTLFISMATTSDLATLVLAREPEEITQYQKRSNYYLIMPMISEAGVSCILI
jgi:hypothetical protein